MLGLGGPDRLDGWTKNGLGTAIERVLRTSIKETMSTSLTFFVLEFNPITSFRASYLPPYSIYSNYRIGSPTMTPGECSVRVSIWVLHAFAVVDCYESQI
jgi:hypothetical protein